LRNVRERKKNEGTSEPRISLSCTNMLMRHSKTVFDIFIERIISLFEILKLMAIFKANKS